MAVMDARCDLPVNMENDVERMVAALRDPACYPHSAKTVEVMETHISWVFLAGEYAYKIKKPVNLGFLDFSSLDARRFYCEEEVRLNRRLAPSIYLGVEPVTGNHAAPHLGGQGQAIEYAIKMRRFAQSALLNDALARGDVAISTITTLALKIAEFHAAAPSAAASVPLSTTTSILAPALDNFGQMLPLLDSPQDIANLARLRAWTLQEHQRVAGEAASRMEVGRVRECHGDLHLGNIALLDGAATPFDCLEFSPALRWIDVMSEVAFLAMDLEVHGRRDLAYVFLNDYLEHTGDYAGVAMLPYYLVYRAVTRAKINLIRASQHDATRQQNKQALEAYRRYIAFAVSIVDDRRGAIVITHGLSGSGKTTLSYLIVAGLGAIRVRSDVERKRLHSLSALAQTDSAINNGIYTDTATARTYEQMARSARSIVGAGFPVVVDAAFLKQSQRLAFQSLARELGVSYAIVNIAVPPETLRARIIARAARQNDASEATLAVLENQVANHEPLGAGELEYAVAADAFADPAKTGAGLCTQIKHSWQFQSPYG